MTIDSAIRPRKIAVDPLQRIYAFDHQLDGPSILSRGGVLSVARGFGPDRLPFLDRVTCTKK